MLAGRSSRAFEIRAFPNADKSAGARRCAQERRVARNGSVRRLHRRARHSTRRMEKIRRKDACGRALCGRRSLCGRRRWPCGRGSHDGVCARFCWVDMSFSRLISKVLHRDARLRHLGRCGTATELFRQTVRACAEKGEGRIRHVWMRRDRR